MRSIAFFPLAFVAGVEGFGWFVGYLAAIFMVLEVRRIVQAWKPVRVRVQRQTFISARDRSLELAQN